MICEGYIDYMELKLEANEHQSRVYKDKLKYNEQMKTEINILKYKEQMNTRAWYRTHSVVKAIIYMVVISITRKCSCPSFAIYTLLMQKYF